MVNNVGELSASGSADERPSEANLLQICGKLLETSDLSGVVQVAQALVHELAPGATIQRCTRGVGSPVAAHPFGTRQVQIMLSRREILLITAPEGLDCHTQIAAAAKLIESRVGDLGRQITLAESVEHLERSERLQRALYAIADQASAAGDNVTPMFRALHDIVGSLMYAENFYIALYNAKDDSVSFPYFADTIDATLDFPGTEKLPTDTTYGPAWSMKQLPRGPTWYLLREGHPLMGPMASISKQVRGPYKSSGSAAVDWLGVPLLRDTEVVGGVVVQSYDEAHHYTEQDKTLLTYVAQHIQTALERRLAHAELEHRVEERTKALQQEVLERQRSERLQTALFQIAELANSTDRIDDFYGAVHHIIDGLLYARNFYIALLSEDATELTFPYLVDERDSDRQPRKLANGMTEYVLRNGALLADEQETAKLVAIGEVAPHGASPVCWLGVPLVCDDRPVGVLAVQSYSPEHHYTQPDQELLTFVSYHIADALGRIRSTESLRRAYADLEQRIEERTRELTLANRDLRTQIIERERIEARLKHEVFHDSLTGLPNRTLLMERLEDTLERYRADPTKGFAVLFMDLDRFKIINDSVGHLIGDDLLIEVGNRISACLKSKDIVARFGGDEFCILLEGAGDADTAGRVAERVISVLNAPFRLASRELFTSTSIGIALAAPHYQGPEELLRDADSAMYRAKAEGRHCHVVFDDDLRKQAVSLLEIENDLRRGLTRNEFVPYYQPIVDFDTGGVIGYEALMRWRHPQRGVLLPADFIEVAEGIGVSENIDWQIFRQVCRDANALAGTDDTFVSINLSAHHFRNPKLDQRLLGLLSEYAVPASRFHVEVTERALLENTPSVKRILKIFRRAGIGISLDDFGTGYSSLSYLHQYPLQMLKIDRSFVADLTKDGDGSRVAVIRAILAMAATLSLQAIAEGVENPTERDILRKLGCRYAQGFLYAKAQPVDAWIGGIAPKFSA